MYRVQSVYLISIVLHYHVTYPDEIIGGLKGPASITVFWVGFYDSIAVLVVFLSILSCLCTHLLYMCLIGVDIHLYLLR